VIIQPVAQQAKILFSSKLKESKSVQSVNHVARHTRIKQVHHSPQYVRKISHAHQNRFTENEMPTLTQKIRHFVNEEQCPVADFCAPGFKSGADWGWGSARNRVGAILNNFPESYLPDSAFCFYKDGDRWCCVHGDFVNPQDSFAGFGETWEEAMIDLQRHEEVANINRAKQMALPICRPLQTKIYHGTRGNRKVILSAKNCDEARLLLGEPCDPGMVEWMFEEIGTAKKQQSEVFSMIG
jgi:hypothetical protein